MTIEKTINGSAAILKIAGALDTETAPQLEALLSSELAGVNDLTLDFEALEYVSSAGLRVILNAQKKMNAAGKMKIVHVNETVMEIIEITGFTGILTIE
ncbi:MAG: STAS domain-containing protein [Clostridia bacterium]|nr:STAS domain-containing protein [Clostridia bacterium]